MPLKSAPAPADEDTTTTTHTYADAIVEDDGIGLRRAGVAVMSLSGTVALLGFTTLTLAYQTWSGYAVQAGVAMALGLLGVAAGWSLLRHGDRLGPRLTTFPRLGRPADFAPEPPSSGGRVRVHSQPIAALPAAPRTNALR